jgi:hypothetical protein
MAGVILVVWIVANAGIAVSTDPRLVRGGDAESRAIAYLAREVPKWRGENGCFSCHNNGDGLRALLAARKRGFEIPRETLSESLDWLARPETWDRNGGEGPFSDKGLARIQFAAALEVAFQTKAMGDRSALERAAALLAEDQGEDGSWRGDEGEDVGSPTTYGRSLATAMACDVLRAAGGKTGEAIERAEGWLESLVPRTVPDAAAMLMVHDAKSPAGRRARDWLVRAQGPDGGWGPYLGSPPEPFDTALALIALVRGESRTTDQVIKRGREALIASQLSDGSWVETTRPAGSESYAQRVSTSAWATLALLSTSGDRTGAGGRR